MADETQMMVARARPDAFVPRTRIAPAGSLPGIKSSMTSTPQIFRPSFLTYMMRRVEDVYRATRLQSIAKYLERIADHATKFGRACRIHGQGSDIRPSRQPHRGATRISRRRRRPRRRVRDGCMAADDDQISRDRRLPADRRCPTEARSVPDFLP